MDGMKKMASRRKTLQSRVSLSSSEQEAQLDKEPKTQPKSQQPRIDSLRRFPLRRSTSKKVEAFLQCLQTPSQPARRSNQVPVSLSASKMREVSSEKGPRGSPGARITQVTDWKDFVCKRLFQGEGNKDENPEPKEREELSEVGPDKIPSTESGAVKVSEKTSLRESQSDIGSVKTPQKRDRNGRWLPKVTSARASSTKGEKDRNPKGSDVKCKANEKSSLVKQTEEPDTELERMKGQQSCVQRRSLRLAKLRANTEKACSLDHIEQHRLGSNSIKTGESVDTGCKPDVSESSEMQQAPDGHSGDEEGLETRKGTQAVVEMDNEEGQILEQSSCDTGSFPEPGCLSVQDTCRSSAQSNNDTAQEQDVGIMTPKVSFDNKQVQTVTSKFVVMTPKTEGLDMQGQILEQSSCDTGSFPEPGCLSVQDTCRSSAHSNNDTAQEQDVGIMPLNVSFDDKEVQTVTSKFVVMTPKTEGLDMQFVEGPSPKEWRVDAIKESPPFEQAYGNLGNGTEFGAVEIEEDASAEGQRVGEGSTREVMRRKPESDESSGDSLDVQTDLNLKAEIPEASEEVKGVIGQEEAATANLHQGAEAQQMAKWKETPKSALQLVVSNLNSSKNFAELQIAVITFFMERKLLITSIGMKKSRKRGIVTFLSGKDASQALKYNGEELLGRALRMRRPLQILRPVAIVKGRKRKLKDADGESSIPAKKKNVQKATILTKKNKKKPELLIKRRKKKQEKKAEKASASQKMKKRHWEITASTEKHGEGDTETSLRQLKKRRRGKSSSEGRKGDELQDKLFEKEKKQSTEKPAFSERTDGKAASLPQKKKKKKRKNAEKKVFLSDKGAERVKEKVASVLQKKKNESKKKLTSSEKTAVKEHATRVKTKKRKKTQEKTSWCLYIQKLRSQNSPCKLKAAIGDFLSARSVPYKEIQLNPDSCSACVELNREGDLNEALQLDTCNILGQVARLSKVEKLGALDGRIDSRTLRVKTLPRDVCAKDLKRLFEKVAGVWICQNVNERFGLVMFETEKDTANALSNGEIKCRGNLLRLDRAYPVKQKKRKILKIKNLPYPISKKHLKSILYNAEDIHLSKSNQSQGVAYVEYKTTKQAKFALKDFRGRGVPGQVVRVASIEEGQESPESHSDGSGSTRSLLVWRLSKRTTVEMLKSIFKGAVGARIPQTKGRRFAFVDFKTVEEATRARAQFQNAEIDGQQMKLFFAKSAQ
ncbi:uncharacterized protein LOC132835269 isoform X2 [Hemiscyllium ocellatum]|uniref:uncharacterized protein LOC132835269 isoform X2 n=1 Tax=Hemiscyllium ocellatum TaxID=170820 RepID=UPI0029671373|nr:uncharacterized protein LOC132835269 isoform X2 [Hemiscyllium ocellatum]